VVAVSSTPLHLVVLFVYYWCVLSPLPAPLALAGIKDLYIEG